MCDEKYLKSTEESYGGKIDTDFYGKKNSRRRFLLCVFLLLLLMCVLICKINENYYSHVFLEKCKYIEIEKRWSITLLKTQEFLLLINIMPLKKILTNLLK